jgi:hypothetical protein
VVDNTGMTDAVAPTTNDNINADNSFIAISCIKRWCGLIRDAAFVAQVKVLFLYKIDVAYASVLHDC